VVLAGNSGRAASPLVRHDGPYPDQVTEAEAAMSGHCGINVTGWAGLGWKIVTTR
jgi:hypothetical protein